MTLVVGIDPDGQGRAAVHLGGMLARSADEELVLCAVLPEPWPPWPPSPARVDAEYQAYLERGAQETLRQARERLPGDVSAETVLERSRSAPAGLLEVAARHDTGLVRSARRRPGRSAAWCWGASARGCCTARPGRSRWRLAASAALRARG